MLIATFEPRENFMYMRHKGPYGLENKNVMEDFKGYLRENQLYTEETTIFALVHDDPHQVPPLECRFDVGAYLHLPDPHNQRIKTGTGPTGKYAIFTIEHTAFALEKFWSELPLTLENYGLCLNSKRPMLEIYPVMLVQNHACQIGIPL